MEIPSEGELPLLFVGRVESMYNTDATRLEPEMHPDFVADHTYPSGAVWQGREDSEAVAS